MNKHAVAKATLLIRSSDDIETDLNQILYGVIYGYPTCCIASFINDAYGANRPFWADRSKAGKHTGFVPCICCAAKVNSGEMTLDELIQYRLDPKTFPDEASDKVLDEVLEDITKKILL